MANHAQIALQLYDEAIAEAEVHFALFCKECKKITEAEIIYIIRTTRCISFEAARNIYIAMEKRFK